MKLAAAQIAVVAAVKDYNGYNFEQYQKDFGLDYSGTENGKRHRIFEEEIEQVKSRNEMYRDGKSTWYAAMNEYSVMDRAEFAAGMLGRASYPHTPDSFVHHQQTVTNPVRKDWREAGVVSPVKNQGQCGSCWAFASTEVIESHYMIASDRRGTVLAPQYLVNCVKNPNGCGGSGGCSGAIAQLSFNLTSQIGIPLENDLPYTAQDGTCKTYPDYVMTGGYRTLTQNDPAALETALATVGPIAVSVCAESWGRYGGGIFEGGCSSDGCSIDHAVVADGYDANYWLIRNSWGAGWGENGYIRLSRAHDKKVYIDYKPSDGYACKPYPDKQYVAGESGVLSDSSYPLNVRQDPKDLDLAWWDCSNDQYSRVLSVSPPAVTLGTYNLITASLVSKVVVNSGLIVAEIMSGSMVLSTCKGQLGLKTFCKLPLGLGQITLNAITMPIRVGKVDVTMNLVLPANAPALLKTATTHVTVKGESGHTLLCLDVTLKESAEEQKSQVVV